MKLRLTLENATGLPATTTASVEFGDRDSLSIGRAQGLDWTLPDPSRLMSGKHCEIRRSAQAYLLYDLSTNGTFVDGSTTRLTSPHALRDGEGLLVGAYVIRVELNDESDPAAHDDKTRLVARSTSDPRLELTLANTPAPAGQHSPTATLGRDGVLRIGRDDSADWTLPDRSGGISRNHCTIRFADDAFVLEDSSANGTFVNGTSVRDTVLKPGDQLAFDQNRFLIEAPGYLVVMPGDEAPVHTGVITQVQRPLVLPQTARPAEAGEPENTAVDWIIMSAAVVTLVALAVLVWMEFGRSG